MSYIMDKWHEVRVLCPWFYRMKLLVDDRFDDIGAAITNSGEAIDLDVMNTNRKTSKSATPLLPSQPPFDPNLAADNENEEEIEWEKTDDENQDGNNKQGTDNLSLNTPQSPATRSGTPYSQGTSITPTVSSAISRRRPGVLRDLTDSLKEIGIAKNKQKKLNDAAMQETQRIEIREKAEVEKKRLDIERELEVRRLALEERQQAFREKMALEARRYTRRPSNSHPGSSHSGNTSVNGIPIRDEHNPLSRVGDEYFVPLSPNIEGPLIGTYHN